MFEVEANCVFPAPAVDGGQMVWGQIWVDLEKKLFEVDPAILILIEEIVEAGGDAFHVVVFLLAKTFDKVFD